MHYMRLVYDLGPTRPGGPINMHWEPHYVGPPPRFVTLSDENIYLVYSTIFSSLITMVGGIIESSMGSPVLLGLGGGFSLLHSCVTYVTSTDAEIKGLHLKALCCSSLFFELLPGIIMSTIGGIKQQHYTLAAGIILSVLGSLHLTAASVYLNQNDNQENSALLAADRV